MSVVILITFEAVVHKPKNHFGYASVSRKKYAETGKIWIILEFIREKNYMKPVSLNVLEKLKFSTLTLVISFVNFLK